MHLVEGTRLGPYRIEAPIGSGGMGEVYRAADDRLGRSVAVKVLSPGLSRDPAGSRRFQREARAIAALNHPHICAIYDVGEQEGIHFLVMELLEGEPLATRLLRGPVPCPEAISIALVVSDTLAVVHQRGLVHRDLKPANIFLTPHGVKLLDFGLARQVLTPDAIDTVLTHPGVVLGTPRYMSPEQLRGGETDHRSDLFSLATVAYEMLTGRPAFDGGSPVDILHAIAYQEPAPIADTVAPRAVGRVLRHALAKDPSRRPESAAVLAEALRAAISTSAPTLAVPELRDVPTRLIVLPFRLLRPDPDTDFLGFGLADAVSASLASLDSIVVRSSLSAAHLAGGLLDFRALADEASVDVVVAGSLLRAGREVRVSAQLVAVPQGSLIWSHTIQAPVHDLFQLQDALTNAIVSALQVPLTAREHRALKRDVPASASAYELYLRANQLMNDSSRWADVRKMYEEAVELDPGYAPAWARLGRVLRVMAKFGGRDTDADPSRAERAFERALALNPDLAMAHHLYAHFEAEIGRASDAMVRLLTRARSRGSDPELFAGLVTAFRYCGLLDESIAAWEHARRLDPAVRSSVSFTFLARGEDDRAIETDVGSPAFAALIARLRKEGDDRLRGIEDCRIIEQSTAHSGARLVAAAYRLATIGDRDGVVASIAEMHSSSGFSDPEGYYFIGSFLARAGAAQEALDLLERVVSGGFHCPSAMRDDPAWDSVRDDARFRRQLAVADAGCARARDAFLRVDGPAIIGMR